jgi:hypothetical protein
MYLFRVRHKLARGAAPAIRRLNAALGNFDEVAWLVGDARSGTTWVADLIARACGYYQLFEPFHPLKVPDFAGWPLNHCQQPGSTNPRLRAALQHAFEAKLGCRRVNPVPDRLFYQGLLVKDVFASLLAAWAIAEFPSVRPILLVRNPFAVAVSKQAKRHWLWTSGPIEMLRQPALRASLTEEEIDYLRAVEERGDFILNQVAVWTLIHAVLIRQLRPSQVHLLIFEKVVADPYEEIRRVCAYLGNEPLMSRLKPERIGQPSRSSDQSSVARVRESRGGSWQAKVTSEQRRIGEEILSRFGLQHFHRDGMPWAGSGPDTVRAAMPVRGAEALCA